MVIKQIRITGEEAQKAEQKGSKAHHNYCVKKLSSNGHDSLAIDVQFCQLKMKEDTAFKEKIPINFPKIPYNIIK